MDTSFQESCTPGYYNNEGQRGNRAKGNVPYMKGINAFNALLDGWRKAGNLEGLELS